MVALFGSAPRWLLPPPVMTFPNDPGRLCKVHRIQLVFTGISCIIPSRLQHNIAHADVFTQSRALAQTQCKNRDSRLSRHSNAVTKWLNKSCDSTSTVLTDRSLHTHPLQQSPSPPDMLRTFSPCARRSNHHLGTLRFQRLFPTRGRGKAAELQ